MAESGGGADDANRPSSMAAVDVASTGRLVSPPGSKTPPPVPRNKRTFPHISLDPSKNRGRPGSEPINADALARALKDFEEAGRQRERTPGTSPSRKRQRVYGGDR